MSLSKWLPCDFEQCHPLLWSGGILVDHWSTISSFPWGRISTTCTMCTSALAMELHPSCTYPSIQPSHSLPLVSSPCGLFGTKFSNFQFDPEWYFQRNFISKYTNFHWTKCIWKCYLQYDSHFVQASICWRLGFDNRNGCMCMLHMESTLIS